MEDIIWLLLIPVRRWSLVRSKSVRYHIKDKDRKKAYAKRLFIFAVIAQVPYALANTEGKVIDIAPLNIFFTLGFCFLMIWGLDTAKKKWLKVLIVVAALVICAFCDWTYYAAIITLAFYLVRGKKEKLIFAYAFIMVIFGFVRGSGVLFTKGVGPFALQFLVDNCGIILSGICIGLLYNGKCMTGAKKFNKWFFYLFYPLHLLVLGLIRIALL